MSRLERKAKQKLRLLDFGSAAMWAFAWLVLAYTMATPSATVAGSLGAFAAFFLVFLPLLVVVVVVCVAVVVADAGGI